MGEKREGSAAREEGVRGSAAMAGDEELTGEHETAPMGHGSTNR
jgi:hypothetical protein